MTPFVAVAVISAIFAAGVTFVALSEGLTFLGPKATMGLNGSAEHFCRTNCRTSWGDCPLTQSNIQAAECPLWKFINADVPTVRYGSPFPA